LKVTNGQGVSWWIQAELAAVNTFLGGSAAGLFGLLFKHPIMNGLNAVRSMRDEAGGVSNAFLAGMVVNGALMDVEEPWAAWIVGLIGGIVYVLLCKVFDMLEIDDACEAVELHGGAGSAGIFAAAFFNTTNGIFYNGPNPGSVFGIQALGWLCIFAWSFLTSAIVYFILNKLGVLRVDLKTEIIGYDYVEFAKNFDFTGKRLIKRKEAALNQVPIVEDVVNQSHEQNDDYGDEKQEEIQVVPEKKKPKDVDIVSKF
jgi:ammonia channel protein AmtB